MVRQTEADDDRTDAQIKADAWEAANYIRDNFDGGADYVADVMQMHDTSIEAAKHIVDAAEFFGWGEGE